MIDDYFLKPILPKSTVQFDPLILDSSERKYFLSFTIRISSMKHKNYHLCKEKKLLESIRLFL